MAEQKIPRHSAITEELQLPQTSAQTSPSDYNTEEMPQTRTTARVEEKSTIAFADRNDSRPQIQSAPASQPSSGRWGFLLAAALGVIALGAGSFFFINSRRSSELQAANLPGDEAKPLASAQPSARPSVEPSAVAKTQSQPQSEPTIDQARSPATQKGGTESQTPRVQSESKPTPASPQENKSADGNGAAVHNFNQGIAFMNSGRYQEALREFEYVKKLDPGNKSVYYLIGQTFHKMGQLDQALGAYRQCTAGPYASVAQSNVRNLERRTGKTN